MEESGMPPPPIEPNLTPSQLKKRRNHGSKYNLDEGEGLFTSLGVEYISIDRPQAEPDWHAVQRANGRKNLRKTIK
jgi:hypothetical protein